MRPIAVALLTASLSAQAPEFRGAQLSTREGGSITAVLRYDPDCLIVLETKQRTPLHTFKYADIRHAEYFPYPYSQSHWLIVKTDDDAAFIRLPQATYTRAIRELETRAHLTILPRRQP